MLSVNEQIKIIQKGAFEILDEEELRLKLEKSIGSNKPLVVKLGLDPSAPDIHLGHAVVLRKIKQIQDLGHRAIIIIGDFTGRIGDPTGRSKARKQLTEREVLQNADTYQAQITKILDPEKTTLLFNSTWLGELRFADLIQLTSKYTLARILERDDFKQRFQEQLPIGIHELFYPLMQAYDSLEIEADIEIGGTDQRFNILMGRDLQNKEGKEKQIALLMPILEGIDGVEKMSKSLGNYVGIHETPQVMFEKIMTIPDALIIKFYELATDIHPDTIDGIKKNLENGTLHPRDAKIDLAHEIVLLYHALEAANSAKDHFIRVFSNKQLPANLEEVKITPQENIIDVITKAKLAPTKSEARRLVTQGGVLLNQEKVVDIAFANFKNQDILQVGKKKFIKLVE